MSYTFRNGDYAAKAYNCDWATVRSVRKVVRALARFDYSVVEARREAHRVLNDFQDNMQPSDAIFARDRRFPAGYENTYITTLDPNVEALFLSLDANYSYREGNTAKDTDAGAGRTKTDVVFLASDQGKQDNVKRNEELLKQLALLATNDSVLWRRSTFEDRLSAVWTAAGAPKPPRVPADSRDVDADTSDSDDEEAEVTRSPTTA